MCAIKFYSILSVHVLIFFCIVWFLVSMMFESAAKRARLDESDVTQDDSCASEESWRGYETGKLYLINQL